MFGLVEEPYGEPTLARNRVAIAVLFIAGLGACALGAALTDWPWSNSVAMMAVVAVFAGALWWMFASRKAGKVRLTQRSRRALKRTFWMR